MHRSLTSSESKQASLPKSAVILCGGRGLRLRPLTDSLPKPMVLVGGRPILEHVVESLWSQGMRRFVLPTGWLGESIRTHVPGLQERFPASYVVQDTGKDTSIAGRLVQVRAALGKDDFLMVNGDTLFDLNLTALHEHHLRTGAIATLASIEMESRFGLILEEDGQVSGFTRGQTILNMGVLGRLGRGHGWINAGISVMREEIFDHFDAQRCENFEAELYPRLIKLGRLAHRHLPGDWFCIDSPHDLELANQREFNKGEEALAA